MGMIDETAQAEIEDLKFLVGTGASRLINLLMDPRADTATLQQEVAFMAQKAGRLAELLAAQSAATGGSAAASSS